MDLTERLDGSLRVALGYGIGQLARFSGASSDWSLGDVTWLPPITDPVHVIGIGLNTRSHFEETAELMGRTPGDFPKYPRLFMRSRMSHVGHGEPIAIAGESDQLDYEARSPSSSGVSAIASPSPGAGLRRGVRLLQRR